MMKKTEGVVFALWRRESSGHTSSQYADGLKGQIKRTKPLFSQEVT